MKVISPRRRERHAAVQVSGDGAGAAWEGTGVPEEDEEALLHHGYALTPGV